MERRSENLDNEDEDGSNNPNIMGARSIGLYRQHIDDASYDSTSVGAAAVTTPMASVGLLVSSPPILSARPKSVRPLPVASAFLTTGRRLSDSSIEASSVTGGNIRESTKLSENRLQLVVECEVSLLLSILASDDRGPGPPLPIAKTLRRRQFLYVYVDHTASLTDIMYYTIDNSGHASLPTPTHTCD